MSFDHENRAKVTKSQPTLLHGQMLFPGKLVKICRLVLNLIAFFSGAGLEYCDGAQSSL